MTAEAVFRREYGRCVATRIPLPRRHRRRRGSGLSTGWWRPIWRADNPGWGWPGGWSYDRLNVAGPAGFESAAAAIGVTDRRAYREAFGEPTNLTVRSSAMATSALTLRYDRATGTATFPTRYRDPALVGHAGGLYQVIPVGIFQPSGEAAWNEANDFDLWRGLLRKCAEELLGRMRSTAARTRRSTTRPGRWPAR